MTKIPFENSEILQQAKVTIDGVDYPVTPAQMKAVQHYLSAEELNALQDNIETGLQTKQDKINVQWQNATINSEYVEGICSYFTFGNILIINIQDLKVIKQIPHGTIIASGFPSCFPITVLMQQFATGSSKRCNLSANGNLLDWFDPIEASDNQFYLMAITILNN